MKKFYFYFYASNANKTEERQSKRQRKREQQRVREREKERERERGGGESLFRSVFTAASAKLTELPASITVINFMMKPVGKACPISLIIDSVTPLM